MTICLLRLKPNLRSFRMLTIHRSNSTGVHLSRRSESKIPFLFFSVLQIANVEKIFSKSASRLITFEKLSNVEFGGGKSPSPTQGSGQVVSGPERQDGELRFRRQIERIRRAQNPTNRPVPAADQYSAGETEFLTKARSYKTIANRRFNTQQTCT